MTTRTVSARRLTGRALDYATLAASGAETYPVLDRPMSYIRLDLTSLLEQHRLSITAGQQGRWYATHPSAPDTRYPGRTALIAACRALVGSVYGLTVKLPAVLFTDAPGGA